MKSSEKTLLRAQHYIQALDIQDRVVTDSSSMPQETKRAFISLSKYNREQLQLLITGGKVTANWLKYAEDELLIYWNESVNIDTELFWDEGAKQGIDYKRKEPLKFALDKGRFRTVHQGMDAGKGWKALKNSGFLQKRFSDKEIERLEEIIAADESKRLGLLQKCLKKGQIPQAEYLRFGDSMAYFRYCDLFVKHFTQQEEEELFRIWKNFQ